MDLQSTKSIGPHIPINPSISSSCLLQLPAPGPAPCSRLASNPAWRRCWFPRLPALEIYAASLASKVFELFFRCVFACIIFGSWKAKTWLRMPGTSSGLRLHLLHKAQPISMIICNERRTAKGLHSLPCGTIWNYEELCGTMWYYVHWLSRSIAFRLTKSLSRSSRDLKTC